MNVSLKSQLLKVFINNSVLLTKRTIYYLHIPVIYSIFPKYLPDFGGMIYVRANYFSQVLGDVVLRLNKTSSFNCTINQSDLLTCFISGNPDKNYHIYQVSVFVNNYTLYLQDNATLSFYGLQKIWPTKGPVEKSTKV